MTIEDLTSYEEIDPDTPIRLTMDTNFTVVSSIHKDFMKRDIRVGDIIIWKNTKFYESAYYKYGLVVAVPDVINEGVKIRNENGNMITLWNTFDSIIVCRYPNYEEIPDDYLRRLGIENF